MFPSPIADPIAARMNPSLPPPLVPLHLFLSLYGVLPSP